MYWGCVSSYKIFAISWNPKVPNQIQFLNFVFADFAESNANLLRAMSMGDILE